MRVPRAASRYRSASREPKHCTSGTVDGGSGPRSGADRTRTDDFLLAKQVLYQLSYRPDESQSSCAKYGGFRESKTASMLFGGSPPSSQRLSVSSE